MQGDAITNAKSAVTKTVTSWFGGFGSVFGKAGAAPNASSNAATAHDDFVTARNVEGSAQVACGNEESDVGGELEDRQTPAAQGSVDSGEEMFDLK